MKSNDVNRQFSDALFEYEISAGFSVSYKIRNGAKASIVEEAAAFGIGQEIVECYRSMAGLNYTWEQSKIEQDDLVGKISVLQLEKVVASWQGNIYFEDEPKESDLRLFHPSLVPDPSSAG